MRKLWVVVVMYPLPVNAKGQKEYRADCVIGPFQTMEFAQRWIKDNWMNQCIMCVRTVDPPRRIDLSENPPDVASTEEAQALINF